MVTREELQLLFEENKIPKYRAQQVMDAIYQQGIEDFDQISTLPTNVKDFLKEHVKLFRFKVLKQVESRDGQTLKALFEMEDGQKIETVLMRFRDGRLSICISSQAGCQLGCKFCATGTMKFGRNLTYEEIADQVTYFWQQLIREGKRLTNLVFMGMGEPFMNYDNVLKAIRILNDPKGMNFGARNMTLSTAGICEGIEKLADEDIQVNLAVSLHAPNQILREKIMPIARRYSLEQLMTAIRYYLEKTHRRVSYEYVMLNGINDSDQSAEELADLIQGQLCHVNLIPYNFTSIEGMNGSARETVTRFCSILKTRGIHATIRVTIGQDIDAACGQLANKSLKN